MRAVVLLLLLALFPLIGPNSLRGQTPFDPDRNQTIGVMVGMIAEDRLRLSREESIDTVWAMSSSEVFLLLRVRRGWDPDQYRRWLTRTLVDQLVVPARRE